MHIFISRIIPKPGLQQIKDAGITYTQWEEKRAMTPEELINNCKNTDALLCSGNEKMDKKFLNTCRQLKAIVLMSVGYDHIDLEEATNLYIPVSNTPEVLNFATAEAAFLLMIMSARKAMNAHKKILKGEWKFFDPIADLGTDLRNKILGIFGLGRIGFEMARLCINSYNMKVIYHNRNRNEKAEKELNAQYVSFDDLLQQSDVLSVHSALTPETKGVFNKDAFSKMKSNAIFVNTSRGGTHTEEDLINAIQSKTIWGAGLDVTNPEPMDKNNVLLDIPSVAILPHIGSATKETRDAMSCIASNNIIACMKGEKLPNILNPEVYNP